MENVPVNMQAINRNKPATLPLFIASVPNLQVNYQMFYFRVLPEIVSNSPKILHQCPEHTQLIHGHIQISTRNWIKTREHVPLKWQ